MDNNDKNNNIEPIPDEFSSYEEAAAFWDTHDTTEYLDSLQPVSVEAELLRRHFEIELDEDVVKVLRARAQKLGTTTGRLASNLLRQQIATK
jgi:CopG antitoxin of type II toxin-antitoxin system